MPANTQYTADLCKTNGDLGIRQKAGETWPELEIIMTRRLWCVSSGAVEESLEAIEFGQEKGHCPISYAHGG